MKLGDYGFTRPRIPPPAPPAPSAKALQFTALPREWFSELPGYAGATGRLTGFNAYAGFALAYSCMQFRATKLAEAPLGVVDETEDGDKWVQALTGNLAPLADLLEQPNPDMTLGELLELTTLYLDGTGRAVWLKIRDNAGRVRMLYPYHGQEFTVYPDPDAGRLYGLFDIQTAAGHRAVRAEDVVFFRFPDPRDWAWGLGPLDAALAHVNIGSEMRRAISAALVNAIRPGATIETTEAFATDQDATAFRERIDAQHGGVVNNGKWLILDRAKLNQLKSGLADLELGPVQGDVETAICACFGVHPVLVGAKVGIDGNKGMADTLEPAMQLYYDRTGRPLWRRIGETLTRQLLRDFDPTPTRRLRFDLSDIDWLKDDLTERTKEAQQAELFWTVDEARVHTGQEPLGGEEGERFLVAGRPTPTLPGKPGEDGDDPDAKALFKRPTRRDTVRLVEQATRASEETLLEVLAWDQLRQDRDAALAALGPEAKGPGDPLTPAEARRLERETAAAIERGIARWEAAFRPAVAQIGKRSGESATASVGVEFALPDPALLRFVEREVAHLVTNVSDTTKDAIRRAVRDGLAEGETVRGVAKRIQEATAFSRERAKLVATTEVTRARNGAALEQMQAYEAEFGVPVMKEWLNSGDSRVRKAHRDKPVGVGGVQVKLDDPFPNGLQAPGEPNCRCSVLYHTPETTE